MEKSEREEFESFSVVQDERTWKRTKEEIIPGLRIVDKVFLNKILECGYGFSFDIDRELKPFQRPSLFLLGRQDHMVGYRDAWKIIESYPRATIAILDVAGHNLQIEQESLFNALVNEWIDRILYYPKEVE